MEGAPGDPMGTRMRLPKTVRDRVTGVQRTLDLAARELAEDAVEDGKYLVICEAHSTCVQVDTRRAAESCSTINFCDDCREVAEKKGQR
jgi:hypothetical protein